ncbi:hypothetical protein ASD38_10245 [Caulobacter sp. Root487D2Y]|uniref:hypothetical protein n=1 Tax=Caulobacter sp. Root487D2Y TaxID=1736547 RepID=UPI0006F488CF|nr:hypothetical protein [Caulobacter sp. Root487D2Y]KQY29699.1 hypothetical protein ASD38_10245 [Caulobacter sp. Root487D2Y]
MADRSKASRLVTLAASGLAVITVATAGCAVWELQLAEQFGHEAPAWIPLSGVYGGKAQAIIKALDTDPTVDLGSAKTLSEAQLRLSPTNHYAWLRLAFIDVVETGKLSPTGVGYLQRSYDVAPYDSLTWRLNMAFETWPSLSPELKAAVIDDLKVNWRTGRRHRQYVAMASRIRNPAGLEAVRATLAELQAQDAEIYRQKQLLSAH